MTAQIDVQDPGLVDFAQGLTTPAYLYDRAVVAARYQALHQAMGGAMPLRYAIKANPHPRILETLVLEGASFDASSLGEVQRALDAGAAPETLSFTGPGKTQAEITGAVRLGIGLMVLESMHQADLTDQAALAMGRVQPVLLRVNPAQTPKGFGARMTGASSQFGVDETACPQALAQIAALPGLSLRGLHIYNGSNCLVPAAIAENLAGLVALTQRLGAGPRAVFGLGLGLPYHAGDTPLPLGPTVAAVSEALAPLRAAGLSVELELGRWLVGPAGLLLTRVTDRKTSGGQVICLCDAGFHTHLAACGMMGSVLRRSWPIRNLSARADRPTETVTLAGPLCTSIDILARDLDLPRPEIGDILAVELSGAYGLTASPVGFISHPTPSEIICNGGQRPEAPR